jgi:hypothetical protein
MAETLYRQPTRSEIIELAAAEGHDADRPTNAGTIHDAVERNIPSSWQRPEGDKLSSMELEKDVEKGHRAGSESISSIGDSDEIPDELPEHDPNIVFWDSPTDPQNPLNWSSKKKWGTVAIVSCITFLTPLASSIFAPGVPDVMKTFNSTNDMLEGFMVSIYVLGFAFGPLFFAPLSEMYGRLPVYHTCNCFFVIFTIVAAVSTNMSMFVVIRFLMGCKCLWRICRSSAHFFPRLRRRSPCIGRRYYCGLDIP